MRQADVQRMIAEEELASRASVSSVKPDAGDHSQSRGRTLSRMLPLPPIQEVEEPFTAVLASLHTLHQFVKKPKRQSPKRPLRLKGQPHEPILSPLLEEDEPLSPTLPRTPLPAGAPAHDWSVGIHEDDSDDEYLSLRPSSSVTGDHYCYK
jgi:hypothetical protein